MYIELPGSPSSTTVAPTSKRHSTNIEIRRSRLASERPPKKGVATKNAFRSGELTAISLIYSRSPAPDSTLSPSGRLRKSLDGRRSLFVTDTSPLRTRILVQSSSACNFADYSRQTPPAKQGSKDD